jgi:hypothetical protein
MNKRTRELIRRERAAQADLTRYYGEAIGQVQRELAVVLHDIETAKAQARTRTRSGCAGRRRMSGG